MEYSFSSAPPVSLRYYLTLSQSPLETKGGFRLDADLKYSGPLNSLYATLRDPDKSWPPGTQLGETREFSFNCIGSAGDKAFPALRFTYLDYAGELISGGGVLTTGRGEREQSQQDLEKRIKAAHAIFGIIDGRRILEIKDEPSDTRYIDSLIPMISLMRKATCPVHFILTKWDLFDGFKPDADENRLPNDRLTAISQKLLRQRSMRGLVRQCQQNNRIVRLIPVSAIGSQFATMDSEGHMRKSDNGFIHPFDIKIPLCAVLPDLFAQIEDKLDQSTENKIAAKFRKLARLDPGRAASTVARFLRSDPGRALVASVNVTIGASLSIIPLAVVFIEWIGMALGKRITYRSEVIEKIRQQAPDMRLSRYNVLNDFKVNIEDHQDRLPASVLTDWQIR